MKLSIYQVDAFTSRLFAGNPAAVCPLDNWLDDHLMQNIAQENNLAETAFFVKRESHYEIRWFTPTVEVDLCGHATLASAYVLFEEQGVRSDEIRFWSHRSGDLSVSRTGELLALNFPKDELQILHDLHVDEYGIFSHPVESFRGKTDILLVYENEEVVRLMQPDLGKLKHWNARGVIVTAPGVHVDFVSRFFAPQSGVDEDPVTGSAHTTLVPYWSGRLKKSALTARQISQRGGDLYCRDLGSRVEIAGNCRLYLKGDIYID